jgi:hypothetical protein
MRARASAGAHTRPSVSTRRRTRQRARSSCTGVDFADDDRKAYGEWGADGLRQCSSTQAAMAGEWEGACRDAWWRRGVRSETKLARLIILGSRHRRDVVGEVFRDANAIDAMCETLERLVPGVSPGAVFHKCPEAGVVMVDALRAQRQLVMVRTSLAAMTTLDMARVIDGAPQLLVVGDLSGVERALESLAEALGVPPDDARLRETIESSPDALFLTREEISIAAEDLLALNDSLRHPTLADFVAAHAEALVFPHMRCSLKHTLELRRGR